MSEYLNREPGHILLAVLALEVRDAKFLQKSIAGQGGQNGYY
jgi:hypothetical protein